VIDSNIGSIFHRFPDTLCCLATTARTDLQGNPKSIVVSFERQYATSY